MDDRTSPSDSQGTKRAGRSIALGITKWIVVIVVVIGLGLAAREAVSQWQAENQKLALELEEIEQKLDGAITAAERSELARTKQRLEASVPRLSNLHWNRIGLASVLYALGMIPSAFLLRRALQAFGQTPSIGVAIAAQLIGHAGKYVPGKAMVIVLRAGVLSKDGVRAVPATVSVFLETFLMMAVGATVAAIVVLWLPVPGWITLLSLAAAGLACLPTLPPVLRMVAKRITKVDELNSGARIDWGLFAAGWGWSLLSWLFFGSSFAALIAAIPSPNALPAVPQLLAIATAAISLAIVVGFASLIPGGAGVRELVLTTILGVSIGPVHGLLAAIAARVLYIVVEAVMAGASWLWLRYYTD